MNRRDFLKRAMGSALALGAANAVAETGAKGESADRRELQKAIVFSMTSDKLSVDDRMKLARDAGFAGVEVPPITDKTDLSEMRGAAEDAGVRIHSIMFGGWQAPLSSPDESVAERGLQNLIAALQCAKVLGADNVLLVPAIVNAKTRYVEAYERSQKQIRKAIPEAEKQGALILVENVWNNFLLSPLEFARYIDEFESPYVQAYFDVGNVVAFGWPEDWIRTLGPRIKKVHLKDFKRGPRQFVNLRDGDVDWPEVRKALADVGYRGYVTAELGGGDEAYLRDVSARMDRIIGEGRG